MNGLTLTVLDAYRDARGWNTHPLDEGSLRAGAYANLHLVSMEPGAIRGNHRHAIQTEEVVIIGGPCLFTAQDAATGECFERVFRPGELFHISIRPGIAHAFKNIGETTSYLLCASGLMFDPEAPDTERVPLLD